MRNLVWKPTVVRKEKKNNAAKNEKTNLKFVPRLRQRLSDLKNGVPFLSH